MNVSKQSMLLYVVTDRTWLCGRSFSQQIDDTLRAGATFLQLREKDLNENEFIKEAMEIRQIAKKYNVPFVINDSINVALASDADGVHIGQGDMPLQRARELLGDGKIIGVSVQTAKQAAKAEEEGADYIGVGAVFPTSTKDDAADVSLDELKKICKSVKIPVVAIGGIKESNIERLRGSGIDGVAVVSAIFASPDIYTASKTILKTVKEVVE